LATLPLSHMMAKTEVVFLQYFCARALVSLLC
jgi:hypothetical protein